MVKFGVWVVDLMLQYTVGFLNAAGHDRGGVVCGWSLRLNWV